MDARRVVITGVGPVSAIGTGREAFFAALRRGQSGVGPVSAFANGGEAAEIAGFDVRDYLETEKPYLDRASQFAFAAMSLAIEDANLDLKRMDRASIGLILGSAAGCLGSAQLFFNDFLEKGPRFVKPILFPHTYANTSISLLAIDYGIAGYHLALASGAVSSAGALLQACDVIRSGRNALVFAGGFEALSPLLLHLHGRSPLSPWALGEGAGILVLEEAGHARARGATVLGELLGGGMTGGDVARAMRLARQTADGRPNAEARIFAAMPDRPDHAESSAVTGRPVVRLKALLGDTLGADAALRTIAALAPEQDGTTLVNAIDPGGSVVCLAVTSDTSQLTPHTSP